MLFIDNFFLGLLSQEDNKLFEDRIVTDPTFAADVAFYLSSKQAARELQETEKKNRFKELYKSNNGYHHAKSGAKVIAWRNAGKVALAAAIITAIIVTINLNSQTSPGTLAEKYIQNEYKQLSVSMGTADELAKAAESYNSGKYAAAEAAFENVITKDSASFNAVQYAGVSAIRAGNYDIALRHFNELEKFRTRYNPAVLLQAVALMKRNHPGDKQEAKLLLQRVVNENLDGKEAAQEWLRNW